MSGVISTRNGVPPENWLDSDPPGGIPRTPDPDTRPHPAPDEGRPAPTPAVEDLPQNEPPQVPPRREAAATITRQTTVQVSRTHHPQQRHK